MHYDYTDNYFNDGSDSEELVECYSCEDTVKIEDCDEYRFFNIKNQPNYSDELICTRCTDSFGEE